MLQSSLKLYALDTANKIPQTLMRFVQLYISLYREGGMSAAFHSLGLRALESSADSAVVARQMKHHRKQTLSLPFPGIGQLPLVLT